MYYDKNKKQILAGMTIKHENGDVEKVIGTGDNIGINGTNKKFFDAHPNADVSEVLYPLHQFNWHEWEII